MLTFRILYMINVEYFYQVCFVKYAAVLSQRRFARSTCTWTVSNIPRLTKKLHQSYNDG